MPTCAGKCEPRRELTNDLNEFRCPRCRQVFCGNCVSEVQVESGRRYICVSCLKNMGLEIEGHGQVTISSQEFRDLGGEQVTAPPPVEGLGQPVFEDEDGETD